MTELTNIGAQMANVLFNLAQLPGERITYQQAEAFDKLCKDWDAARRATPSSECALPPLPVGSVYCALDMKGQPLFDKGWMFAPIPQLQAQAPLYTAEHVEQIRREAVEADRRARVNSPEIPDGSLGEESTQAEQCVIVGTTVAMPGSGGGFTMCAFNASDVPIGTKLYAAPPLSSEPQDSA